MSKEYLNPAKAGTCSAFARKILALAKPRGLHSLGLLQALLTVEGSVVAVAFEHLGYQRSERLESLRQFQSLVDPEVLSSELHLSRLAEQKAKAEGLPLSSDHLLEVIWDEDTQGYDWLHSFVDASTLESALNKARYPDEPDTKAHQTGNSSPSGPLIEQKTIAS